MAHLLLTGADTPIARAWISESGASAEVRVVDTTFHLPPLAAAWMVGELRDPAFARRAVAGVNTVIHLEPLRELPGSLDTALEELLHGSYELFLAAEAAGVERFILASTLDVFHTAPPQWRVDEAWQPKPDPQHRAFGSWLVECSLRELARVSNLSVICLRFGQIVATFADPTIPLASTALHQSDAIAALNGAIQASFKGWNVFHITAAGTHAKIRQSQAAAELLGYRPRYELPVQQQNPAPMVKPAPARPSSIARPLRRVVVIGSGGPLGAAVAAELAADYTLCLADVRSWDEVASAPLQSPDAPVPFVPVAPHEWRQADIADPAQVEAICAGADAVINCTVVRNHSIEAFRVNAVGVYHLMCAAAKSGVGRIIHTGPYMAAAAGAPGYDWDAPVSDDAPPRPGAKLYFHTKYLGLLICQQFAEQRHLPTVALLLADLVNPNYPSARPCYSFTISWADAARAIRCALEVSLPASWQSVHINADLPHGVFPNTKARTLLGWAPRDTLEPFYSYPTTTNNSL